MSLMKNVILIDEQPLVLNALSQMLTEQLGFRVMAQHTHSDRAFFDIIEHHPDLVLMDLELPGRGAIEVAEQIMTRLPATRTVFLTSYDTDIFIDISLRLGVAGFLLKTEPVQTLIDSLKRISLGETVYSDPIQERLHFDQETREYRVRTLSFFSSLTLRQIQVL
jgi:DNA-binding NarL/FixJ family response regulator